MNYYIIVVNDQPETKDSAREIYDILMEEEIWGFGVNTANRKRIQVGDKLVFYLAGTGGQVFAGTAEVSSLPKKTKKGDIYRSNYWFNLTDINVWDEPKPVKNFLDELEFIVKPEVFGTYFQGGSRIISEKDYYLIVSKTNGDKYLKDKEGDRTEFVLEKYLEDFIISNWDKINFEYDLEIFTDKDGNVGQQYYTAEIGYIDILARDKKTNDLVVIELKKGKESDYVVGQILRYMGWVEQNLCKKGQKVRGIIILKECDKKLNYALSKVSDIEAREYNIDFQLKK